MRVEGVDEGCERRASSEESAGESPLEDLHWRITTGENSPGESPQEVDEIFPQAADWIGSAFARPFGKRALPAGVRCPPWPTILVVTIGF